MKKQTQENSVKQSSSTRSIMKLNFDVNLLAILIVSSGIASLNSKYSFAEDAEMYESVQSDVDSDQDSEVVVLRKRAKPSRVSSASDDGVNVNVNVDADADSKSISSAKADADAEAEADSIASRSAYVRKTRVREEVQNNDLLQERLEALRLKDEQRRTRKLIESEALAGSDDEAALVRRENRRVVVSTSEAPEDDIYVVRNGRSSTKTVISNSSANQGTRIGLSSRFGTANMGGDSYYDVSTQFLMGVGLLVETGDTIGFEMGYTYGEYGIAMASGNPLVNSAQFYTRTTDETVELHQNIFDLGLRAYLLPRDSVVRLYLSGGGAYAKNYVNYNDQVLNYLDNSGLGGVFGKDYESTAYMGQIGTGLDVAIFNGLTLGIGFKYYYVFRFNDNTRLYYPSLYYGGPGAPNISEVEKAAAGSSIGNNNFYTATAALTYYF